MQASSVAGEAARAAKLEDAGALANRLADLQAAWDATSADLRAQAEAQRASSPRGGGRPAAQSEESLSRLNAAVEDLAARIAAEAAEASRRTRGEVEAARAGVDLVQ